MRKFLLVLSLIAFLPLTSFAAAITPDSVFQENFGSVRVIIARFSAGTADDADTWASSLTGILAFWTADRDNPTTQASVGVAVTESSATFTFYPAEDNKAFDLYVVLRS